MMCNIRGMGRCGTIAVLLAAFLTPAARGADPIPLEVHEWSLWIVDPTHSQTNAKDQYPNTLPVFIESNRSRLSGRVENRPSPLSVITFYGEPATGVEVELQLAANSRFCAHWPPAETKTKRARWLDVAFSPAADPAARITAADDESWVNQARQLPDALFARRDTRGERFLCYDVETAWAPQVKLTGGPDRYQVENLDKSVVDDLFICAPAGDKYRIGRLKQLPGKVASPDKVKDNDKKPAEKPAEVDSAEAKAAAAGGNNVVFAFQVAGGAQLAISAEAKPADAKPAEGKADEKKAEEKAPPITVEVALSEPLARDSDQYLAETRNALKTALVDAGLRPAEADLFLSIYADQIFKSKEMVVLFRLPGVAIEEQFPLVTYPDAKRIIRVPLVLMRNVDPQLQGGLKDLVARLGDANFQERDNAEKKLQESGRLAVPLLKEALTNDDPEIVIRAERLLLAQNESIDASSGVLPKPKEEKKDDAKADAAKPAAAAAQPAAALALPAVAK